MTISIVTNAKDIERNKQDTVKDDTLDVKEVTFDDVLEKELGVGLYQMLFVFVIAITNFATYATFEYIFVAAKIPHRCRITECGETSKSMIFEPSWLANAIPMSSGSYSSCERFSSVGGNGSLEFCPASIFNQSASVKCDSYVYGSTRSLVYDFDLGCQEWYRTLAGTLNGVGIVLALPLTGYLSDNFGRRLVLFGCAINCGIFGVIKAFSVSYEMYLVLQILQTTFGSGIHSTVSIYSAELVTPKYRVLALAFCSVFASLGKSIVGLEAMFVHNWRHLLIFAHIPCFVPLLYFWVMPESARWLISKGRYDKAKKEIEFIAKINRTQISEKSMSILLSPKNTNSKDDKKLSATELMIAIASSRVLLQRAIIAIFWFFSTLMVYYGLTINSTSLSDNSHLNFILVALVQIPGFIYMRLVMDRFGRRFMMLTGYTCSAVCNLAFSFIAKDQYALRLTLYLLGQLATSGTSASIYVYVTELFPTECRHRMLAFCSMIGHLGQVLAPMTPALMVYWSGLPTTIFACLGFASAILVFFQPETMGSTLPNTIEEAERIGAKATHENK